ncbi:MAG: sensor histidine kinase, partial [Tumebacillaceae bacterium]
MKMKTLYLRIVVMTFFVVLGSSILAFLLSNVYYQLHLKAYNEQKLMTIAERISSEYERHPMPDLADYLQTVADLNYQLYVVDEQGHHTLYGD